MHEMGEMKRAQELRVDEISVQKLKENRETIQKLSSQLREMQDQMNSLSDSGEFQEMESNYSGRLSYVSSQPAMMPSSRSMLSFDKRLPPDTWNTSGLQDNVFGNQFSTFDSPRDHHQGIHPHAPQKERGSVPPATGSGTFFFARQTKWRHNSNADICKKAVDCEFRNTGGVSAEFCGWTAKTANLGVAIRQISSFTIILGVEDTIQKSSDYVF